MFHLLREHHRGPELSRQVQEPATEGSTLTSWKLRGISQFTHDLSAGVAASTGSQQCGIPQLMRQIESARCQPRRRQLAPIHASSMPSPPPRSLRERLLFTTINLEVLAKTWASKHAEV